MTVSVRGESGPRAGAIVRVLAANGRPVTLVPRAATDKHGEVVFRGVPPGTYRVTVDASGAAPLLSDPFTLDDNHRQALVPPLSDHSQDVPLVPAAPGRRQVIARQDDYEASNPAFWKRSLL